MIGENKKDVPTTEDVKSTVVETTKPDTKEGKK